MKTPQSFTLIMLMLASAPMALADHMSSHSIEQRMQSKDNIGLYKKGEEPQKDAANAIAASNNSQDAASDAPIDAEKLYQTGCMACHASGAAGAPKLGVASDWQARIAKGRETLISNSINGIGAMPARGGFNYNDQEMAAIVDYMLEKSQ